MKRVTLIMISILIIGVGTPTSNISAAETKQKIPESPRDLTLHFLKLDFEGARLGSDDYRKSGIAEFIVPGEYMSPGWDMAIVIRKYEIEKTRPKSDRVAVTVKYDVIGSVSNELTIKSQTEHYTFRFKQKVDRWFMIEPYDLPPHISVNTAIRHLDHLLKIQGENSTTTRSQIEKLRQLGRNPNK
jgi:hypothetical protein